MELQLVIVKNESEVKGDRTEMAPAEAKERQPRKIQKEREKLAMVVAEIAPERMAD
jgi:hypothetical protein